MHVEFWKNKGLISTLVHVQTQVLYDCKRQQILKCSKQNLDETYEIYNNFLNIWNWKQKKTKMT